MPQQAPRLNRLVARILRYYCEDFKLWEQFTCDGYLRLDDLLSYVLVELPQTTKEGLVKMIDGNDRLDIRQDPDKVPWVASVRDKPNGRLPPLVGYFTPPHARRNSYAQQMEAHQREARLARNVPTRGPDDQEARSAEAGEHATAATDAWPWNQWESWGHGRSQTLQTCTSCDTFMQWAVELPRPEVAHESEKTGILLPAESEAVADQKDLSWHQKCSRPGFDYYWEYTDDEMDNWIWIHWVGDNKVPWNGLPAGHPVPLTLADLQKLPALPQVTKFLSPLQGPRFSRDFSKMGARGRMAWRQQQTRGFEVIGPPEDVERNGRTIHVSGVLQRSEQIQVTKRDPDRFAPIVSLFAQDAGPSVSVDPWFPSIDMNGARRGIQVIDGPLVFYYPGPCTVGELAFHHASQRRCLHGYDLDATLMDSELDGCYFSYFGHNLDDSFWVPVGVSLCMLPRTSTDAEQI